MHFTPTLSQLASTLLFAGSSICLQAAAIIYEPFDGSAGGLNGATGGTGLSGAWSGSRMSVVSGSLTYGALPTSGNSASQDGNSRLGYGSIALGSSLSDAGFLNDDSVLWFSYLFRTPAASSNDAFEFILASDGPVSFFSGLPDSGSGIGTHLQDGTSIRATTWDSSRAPSATGGTVASNEIALVVGKITWGASGTDADTIEAFFPGTDLQLPGSSVSTASAVLDQSTFDTLTFSSKDDAPDLDEIRFGASYTDVVPIPEPSSLLLGGLAVFGFLRRRR